MLLSWCWRRLLRVPWTARRSNQSILKEISPGCSLEGLMLKLKTPSTLATWCKELTHLKRPWCWEILKAGGEGDDRGGDGWMVSPTLWTWVWVDSGVGDGRGGLACCSPWGHKELDTTEWVNWTGLNWRVFVCIESIQEGLEYLNKLIAIFHFVEKVYLTWFHLTLCVKMA